MVNLNSILMLMQKKFVMSKTSNMSGQDPTTVPLDADRAPLALSPGSRPASRCLCSRWDKRKKKNKVNEENTEPLRWSEKGKEARMGKAGSPADELPAATRCPQGNGTKMRGQFSLLAPPPRLVVYARLAEPGLREILSED